MMHPLLAPVEIPGPEGSPINLCPPRSQGPLAQRLVRYLRQQPVSLSYDPVQDGWLPAGTVDDLLDTPELLTSDSLEARLVPVCRTRLEAAAVTILDQVARDDCSAPAAAQHLWRVTYDLIRRYGPLFGPPRQLEALEAMQLRAAQIIGERLTDEAARPPSAEQQTAFEARYRLRPWQADDAERFVELLDDPRIWQHLPEDYPNPLTVDLARDLIEISNRSDHHLVRAIERDGEVIGQIRLSRQGAHVRPPVDAEVSYWIGVPYWGQGVASSVIPAFTAYCFSHSRVSSIFARVSQANPASSRVLEKSGYRYAGNYYSELKCEPDMRTYRCFRAEYRAMEDLQ